jgi:HEAT repeat protein
VLNSLLVASCLIAWTLFFPRVAAAPGGELEEEPAYMGRPLHQWILDLKDADPAIRFQAAYRLSRMGPVIRSAFPALKSAVKDTDPSVRQYAAEALGYTGPQALPVLLELLESEENRYGAMVGLQQMQTDAFPELIKRLTDGEPRQRRGAAAALHMAMSYSWRQPGDVRPALRRALKDPDAMVRIEAIQATRLTTRNRSVSLDDLLELLKDKDPEVRFRASGMLRDLASFPETARPVFQKLLSDSDKRVRVNTASAMLELDSQPPAAMQVILDAMRDKNEAVRRQAMFAFDQIPHQYSDSLQIALPDLIEFVRDYKQHPPEVVGKALWAFSSLEPDAKAVVPLLKAMLQDADPAIREQAAHTLVYNFRNDPDVRSMLPDSIKRVPHGMRFDATAALLTLKKRPENVLSGLLELLQATDQPGPRWHVVRILAEMGPEAKEAIPALRRALEDKSPMFRESVLVAICRIEPGRIAEMTPTAIRLSNWQSSSPHEVIRTLQTRAGEVTPVLVQGLKDPDPQYRLRAGFLLMNLGPAARPAVPELRVALENKEPMVRILAAITLARINPQTEGLVPVLKDGLAFNDLAVREQVFSAIQQLGPAARELVPDLVRAMKDKRLGQLRSSAAFALQSTRPEAEVMEPLFAALVKDSDPQVRDVGLRCLSQISLKDRGLLTTLLDMLHDDPNGSQQHNLTDVIRRFGPAASEELAKRLNDKDPMVRNAFLNLYLGMGGVNQDELYSLLDRAMKDDAPNIRLTAASRLMRMGRISNTAAEQVLPLVKQCLASSDLQLRRQAIGVLAQTAQSSTPRNAPAEIRRKGPPETPRNAPAEVISLLVEQAKAKDADARVDAIGALTSIQPKEAESLLIQALKDKDARVRSAVVQRFGHQLGRMKEAVPALIELLKRKDDRIIGQVIDGLSQAGRNDSVAIAALIEYYRKLNLSSYMRAYVLSAIVQCGANAKDVVPLCIEALKDEDDNLVQTAVRTLIQLDPANKMLVSALVDVHGRERDLDRRIGQMRPSDRNQKPLGGPAVKELSEILANEKDADRRVGAAIILGTMVQDAKSAEDALKNALKDADPRVRLHAAHAYLVVTNETRTPMPVLLAALKDKDIALRRYAAQILAGMGKEASPALPQLLEALKDQDDGVAGWLIRALSQMGRDAAPAIPVLVDIVRDGGAQARGDAADALKQFGREAKDAVPGLLDMLKSGRGNRSTAAWALVKIATPAEAVPALLEVLMEPSREREPPGEHVIVEALIQFGPGSVGPVAELLQHKRAEVRIRAMNVFVRFGKQAQNIVPQLIDVMDDKDDDVALSAAEAVWSIDRRPEVLPHFVRGLKAKTANTRARAARNLMNMGAEAKSAVPELVAACKDNDSAVRREAYRALSMVDNETARKLGNPDADEKQR